MSTRAREFERTKAGRAARAPVPASGRVARYTPHSAHRTRRGATLLELVIALAILGLMGAVAGLAFNALAEPAPPTPADRVAAARRQALETRRPVQVAIPLDGRVAMATALPDGTVVADSALGIDPLTGRPRAAR